jgi:hypothetical protein
MPNAGNPAAQVGFVIQLHWAFKRLVAIRGYLSEFRMQNCIKNHALAGENLPDQTTCSALTVAFSHSSWVCDS